MAGGLIHEGLEAAADRYGDRVALRDGDQTWTFADLDGMSNAFARHLTAEGVTAGERVALMSSNRVELVVAVQALSKLGAAAVLLSPAWKAREVDHALGLTQARHGIADGDGVNLLAGRLGGDRITDLDDPAMMRRALARLRTTLPLPNAGPDDDAIFVFSSGTTGLPKAVRHTHRSLGAATRHWVSALGLGPDDRFQVATPPSHILGLLNLLAAVEAGASVRLHRRFDLDEVLRRIASDRITLEMAVAPIALALANHPHLEDYDLSSLRYIMWGATPVTESVARTVTQRTGVRWLPAYGASELPVIAANPVAEPDRWRLDSAGLPAPDVELRVVSLTTGEAAGHGAGGDVHVLPRGETGGIGEIQARSPSLMAGYLPEEANAEAFVDDGWYRTGDVGWLEPEGWVHLTDRSKEMIKVKGFQVAPAEIEAVLHGHPAVLDCAVFGVADEQAGEVPAAAVQLDLEPRMTRGEVDGLVVELEHLVADTLATYKHLSHLVVVDAIPRLPSGKVLRRTLRDEWAPLLADNKVSHTTAGSDS